MMPNPVIPPDIADLDNLVFNLSVMLREYGNRPVPKAVVTELYTKLDFEDPPALTREQEIEQVNSRG